MSNVANNPALSRVEALLDENSFVELGALVTARSTDFNLSAEGSPSDGVIIGHGLIDGNLVFVFSQDPSVMGGSIGEMHAKKILSVYDMAVKMGAPVIGLLDSTGVRLQESVDALESIAAIYAKATSASGVVPQIMSVYGNCGGGLSVLTAISDFTFMVEGAKLYVNAPDAIPGNRAEVCDNSSASFQLEAGNIDAAGTEEDMAAAVRKLIAILPGSNVQNGCIDDCLDDLNRAAEGLEGKIADTALFAAELSDNHVVFEAKAGFAKDMFTGFILLGGVTVGVVGNRSQAGEEQLEASLSAFGAAKAAEFINFCDSFDIPLLSLTNVAGYKACMCNEKRLMRALGKMTYAFANATVPKISFIVGQAIGSAYVLMNSKSLGADLVYALADAEVAPMDPSLAAQIICGDDTAAIAETAAAFADNNCGVANAARRGYIDRLVNPADARKYLIAGFDMLLTKEVIGPYKKHGTK